MMVSRSSMLTAVLITYHFFAFPAATAPCKGKTCTLHASEGNTMLQRATRNEKGNVATIKDEAGHEARHKMKLGATLTHGVPLYGYDRAVFAKTPMDLMRAAIMQDTDREHAAGEYVGQSPGHSKFSEITAQFELAVDNVTTQQEYTEVFGKLVMDLRASADAGDDWAEAWATQDGDLGCGGNSPGQPCEIQFNARGWSDGLCVSKSAGNMCWAFLNKEHAPEEYVGQPSGQSKFSEITAQFLVALDNVTTQQEYTEVFGKLVTDLRSSADAGDDWAKDWATQDGDPGCGGNSPGQICEIQFIDKGRDWSDGVCVSKSAGNMCWAFLNKEHAPEEYVGQPEQTKKKKKNQQKKRQNKGQKKKKQTNQKNKKKQRNSKRNKGI